MRFLVWMVVLGGCGRLLGIDPDTTIVDGGPPDSSTGGRNVVTITVTTTGDGHGTVTSDVGGISCGTACEAMVSQPVLLTSADDGDSFFTGWSGCPVVIGATCMIDGTHDISVDAEFRAPVLTPFDAPVRAISTGQDGGFVVAGGDTSGSLVRYDRTGIVEWSDTLTEPGHVYYNDVASAPDGGFVAVGQEFDLANERYEWVQVHVPGGGVHDSVTYPNHGSFSATQGFRVTVGPNNEPYVAGNVDLSNRVVFPDGTQGFMPSSDGLRALGGPVRFDNGTVVVGLDSLTSGPTFRAWDSSENVLWTVIFPIPGSDPSTYQLKSVRGLPSGGFAVVGCRDTYAWVATFTSDGTNLWSQWYAAGENACASDLAVANDGSLLVVGGYLANGDEKAWLFSVDAATGTMGWERSYPSISGAHGVIASGNDVVMLGDTWARRYVR